MASIPKLWKWAMAATMLALLSALGACNTVEGVGEDIESIGQTTERTAEKAGAGNDEDEPPPQR